MGSGLSETPYKLPVSLICYYFYYRASLKGTLILTPLLGSTWIFGFLSNGDSIVFQYLFVILTSLQGFFIFMMYCVLNKEVGIRHTSNLMK